MKESARESNDSFKECSTCFNAWKTRDGFLKDPKIQIIGYQANFKHLELGLLLFNHLNRELRKPVSPAMRKLSERQS